MEDFRSLSFRDSVEYLSEYSYEEIKNLSRTNAVIKSFINDHRMLFERLPMEQLQISLNDKYLDINMENVKFNDDVINENIQIEREEVEEVTCETNPKFLIIDADMKLMSRLNPKWVHERENVVVKNIAHSYEFFVVIFRYATHLQLESAETMKMDFILSVMENVVQLECRGAETICKNSDLEKLTRKSNNFELLELNLNEESEVNSDGLTHMIQRIHCIDGASIKIGNFQETRLEVYDRIITSPFFRTIIFHNDHFEIRRNDGKTIKLFTNQNCF